jgi:hypothetical protein
MGPTHALKRGGKETPISLDTGLAESRYRNEPSDELTLEKLFERRWAMTVLELVLERLRSERAKAGKSEQFEKLEKYLTGEKPGVPYKQAAESLGMSEGAVKVEVHRMRRRFGELLHEETAQTVTSLDHVDGEIRHLLSGSLRLSQPSCLSKMKADVSYQLKRIMICRRCGKPLTNKILPKIGMPYLGAGGLKSV